VVKLLSKRWWAEARARRAESRGGVPDRRPNVNCAEWWIPAKKVPDLKCEVTDLLLEVLDLKQEVADLRSGGIPLNLTSGLVMTVSRERTAEPIKMPFGGQTFLRGP